MTYDHWNSATNLPPVGCPLVINFYGFAWRVERAAHVESRDRILTYTVAPGVTIRGRFMWTFP